MQGRTKGIFEDVFVLLIVVLLGWGGFIFFFTEDEKEIPQTTVVSSQVDKQEESIITSEQSNSSETSSKVVQKSQKISLEEKKTQKILNHSDKKQELVKQEEKDIDPVVNLDVLQKFLIGTKQKIKKTIIVIIKIIKKKSDCQSELPYLKMVVMSNLSLQGEMKIFLKITIKILFNYFLYKSIKVLSGSSRDT